MAAAYLVEFGIKQPGERAFAGRYDMKGNPAFYSFGPVTAERRLRELRSPNSLLNLEKSWYMENASEVIKYDVKGIHRC